MPQKPRPHDKAAPGGSGTDREAEAALARALARHRAGRLDEALAGYRALLARRPQLADAHHLLGLGLYQSGKAAPALEAIDAALARDPDNPEYANSRGIVLLALGRATEAADTFRRTIAAVPDHAKAIANLGNALKALGDLAGALEQYRRATEADPAYAEGWFNLGNAQRAAGDRDGALASYRRALRIAPHLAAAQASLGALLGEAGDHVGARQAYEGALASGGERPGTLLGLMAACEALGDFDAAERYGQLLATLTPPNADALDRLGGFMERRGRTEEARAFYQRALGADPRHARAAFNLGLLDARSGDSHRAASELLTAKSLGENDPERMMRIGLALHGVDRLDDAIDCLERAAALRPEHAETHAQLGALLLERRETERALEHLEYAAAEGLDTALLHHQLGLGQFRLCRLPAALDRFRAAIERAPEVTALRSAYLMALNYDDSLSPDALFETHRRVMRPVNERPAPDAPPARPRARDERIRIGYVSADFRRHSCANYLMPLLEAHDRGRFEILCYANNRQRDESSEAFRAAADRWRDIVGLDDEAAAALVREDAVDLLVDCGGHTGDNRLDLFRLRPAPVQATWLGYPNTTALDAIRHRLVDPESDPAPAADALATENLLRIEGGFLAYRPQRGVEIPDPAPGPVERGEAPVFGCFNNANKISPATIRLWARLLATRPAATLVLRNEQYRHEPVRREFLSRFSEAGVDPARVRFAEWHNDLGRALAGHAEIDVALDPLPYNGTTTTCEALWMGVPVVTLAGDRHAARVGASLLRHAGPGVGLGDLVAPDAEAYLRIAAGLVDDAARLAHCRRHLRSALAASPVCDAARLARAVEAFYVDAVPARGRP